MFLVNFRKARISIEFSGFCFLIQNDCLRRIRHFRTVFPDDVDNRKVNVFLYLKPLFPDSRFCKTIDKYVEGRRTDLVEVDDEWLALVDTVVFLEHFLYLADDGFYLARVVTKDSNGKVDPPVEHSSRVFDRDGRKQIVGNV